MQGLEPQSGEEFGLEGSLEEGGVVLFDLKDDEVVLEGTQPNRVDLVHVYLSERFRGELVVLTLPLDDLDEATLLGALLHLLTADEEDTTRCDNQVHFRDLKTIMKYWKS